MPIVQVPRRKACFALDFHIGKSLVASIVVDKSDRFNNLLPMPKLYSGLIRRFTLRKQILALTAFLSLSVVSHSVQADIIRCVFTEPFFNMTYSMAQQSITVTSPNGTRIYRNVGFQILAPGRFVLGDVRRPLVDLRLNNKGSDGMSDYVYPYTAAVRYPHHPGGKLRGGCESNYLRKRMAGAAPESGSPVSTPEILEPIF